MLKVGIDTTLSLEGDSLLIFGTARLLELL